MGKTLYRQYRSKSFDEIIGQDHIVRVLKNSLKANQVAHAYLLTGPRGVGKTSIARILAYAVNDQAYSSEANNLDIIEIDAASNRRIDEIREIREKVNIAPTIGKYKIYIIDEVHMLTKEAFNALLKTLEEPPKHVIFILATTEFHKLPDTIVSRCVKLTFKSISADILATELQKIAKKEHIDIDKLAINLLAEHANGSFRDGLSLLEQLKNLNQKITLDETYEMLGLAKQEYIEKIMITLVNGQIHELKQILETVSQSSSNEALIASQLIDYVSQNIEKYKVSQQLKLIDLQKDLLDVASYPNQRVALELCLYKYCLSSSNNQPTPEKINNSPTEPEIETNKLHETEPIIEEKPKKPNLEPESIDEPKPTSKKMADNQNTEDFWKLFLDRVKDSNSSLYSLVRMAEPNLVDQKLILKFKFAFHAKKANDSKNKPTLTEITKAVLGDQFGLQINLEDKKLTKTRNEDIQNVSNIFGSTEVLES